MRPMPDPLCCVVLSMLEREPLRAYDVAHRLESRGLIEEGAGFQFALATLERPSGASLIRHRPLRAPSARFALTHRGRSELHLQRILWLRAAGLVPPSARLTRGRDRCEARRDRKQRARYQAYGRAREREVQVERGERKLPVHGSRAGRDQQQPAHARDVPAQ